MKANEENWTLKVQRCQCSKRNGGGGVKRVNGGRRRGGERTKKKSPSPECIVHWTTKAVKI